MQPVRARKTLGFFFFSWATSPSLPTMRSSGLLANHAGVEDDHVGLVYVFGFRVAFALEGGGHVVRVGDVHLAADSPYKVVLVVRVCFVDHCVCLLSVLSRELYRKWGDRAQIWRRAILPGVLTTEELITKITKDHEDHEDLRRIDHGQCGTPVYDVRVTWKRAWVPCGRVVCRQVCRDQG